MAVVPFEEFIEGLTDLQSASEDTYQASSSEQLKSDAIELARVMLSSPAITRELLAKLVNENPRRVPLLASCVGIGLEQLKRRLRYQLGTSGWVKLAKKDPLLLISELDKQFGLVGEVESQIRSQWTFAEVLADRALWSQGRASHSVRRGRQLENAVERVLNSLGLNFEMRKKFVGLHGRRAPCDFAVPVSGEGALIVGAVKGFNSTGSKLSDAVREVEEMAQVRLPTQFVFAFIDGIGWLGRQADLRRIHGLWSRRSIDGLYSLTTLNAFESDLTSAARRLGLIV